MEVDIKALRSHCTYVDECDGELICDMLNESDMFNQGEDDEYKAKDEKELLCNEENCPFNKKNGVVFG